MRLFRSEIVKVISTRSYAALVIGAVAVVLLGTVSTIMSADTNNIDGPLHEQTFYFLASINAGLFALVAGIRVFTDEFRHGTIITTLLTTGSRVRVLAAKVTVAALSAAALAIVALGAMSASALLLSSMRDAKLTFAASDVGAMAGMVLGLALWAAVGVGIGAVVRHQVAAIVGGLVWVLVLENIGSSALGASGRFLPGQAAHGLAQASVGGLEVLGAPSGAIVLGTYAALATLVAAVTLVRRDVA